MSDLNRLRKLRSPAHLSPWFVGGGIVLLLLAAFVIFTTGRWDNLFGNLFATPVPPGSRVLAAPISQQQGGVTVTIVQAIADNNHTLVIYRVAGLANDAAAAPGERQSLPLLHLPDGVPLPYRSGAQDSINGGYFEFAPAPAGADDLILELYRLPLVRAGSAPEKWQLAFHVQANPDPLAQAPTGQTAGLATPTAAGQAVLIARVQALVKMGYAEFSGKAGWVHMIDENYSSGPASNQLRIETWYEINAAGLVTRYVTWQRRPDGALVQSSAAKGGSSYDFTAKKAYPYLPETLKFDWGLLRSLQEDAPRYGYPVKSAEAVCAGQSCLKVTIVTSIQATPSAGGQAGAAPRTETEYQVSLATGRILQSQTTTSRADGTQTVSGGRPVLIERADAPPPEVLDALGKIPLP